jgi:multiple sugar transport system substrate-binding protein
LALLGVVAVGCGGPLATAVPSPSPGSSPVASAPTATAPTASVSLGPPITLTVWDHQAPRLQAMASLLPRFEAQMAAQGVDVKVQLVSGDATDQVFADQLRTAYAAGTGPDLTSFTPDLAPSFESQGWLLDLTSRLAAWNDWQAHFYPVLRQRVTNEDGHIYTVPRGADVVQLFYWPSVLAAYGIPTTQPRTWDDLLARMRLLEQRTGRPPLLIPSGTAWGSGGFQEGFVDLALASGCPLYQDGAWVAASPGLLDAFQLYATLVHDRLLPVGALDQPQPWEPTKYVSFPAGLLAVTTQGTWGWTYDWGPQGRAPIDDVSQRVRTWQFPGLNGQQPFVWAAENWDWAISARSAHPDLAFALLQFLTTGQPLAVDLAAVGSLAPRDDVLGYPPYAQVFYSSEERLLATGRSLPYHEGIDRVANAAAAATQAILDGRTDGPAAMALYGQLLRQGGVPTTTLAGCG